MKRKKLLDFIERAIESEDKIAEGMTKDISSALEWCDCSEESRAKVRSSLLLISRESADHSRTLVELRERISKSDKGEF